MKEWSAVLYFADKWNFKSVRVLAIKNLSSIASPIDKIVLGRRYHIDEWLSDAYEAVCKRPEPLTLEEGRQLDLENVIKISAIRHDHGIISSVPPKKALLSDVRQRFDLAEWREEKKALEKLEREKFCQKIFEEEKKRVQLEKEAKIRAEMEAQKRTSRH